MRSLLPTPPPGFPSEEQRRALDLLGDWCDANDPKRREFVLAGLAGTGKTTLLHYLPFPAMVFAPTNKAASVLRRKGVPAATVHNGFYELVGQTDDQELTNSHGEKITKRGELEFEFVGPKYGGRDMVLVFDEASMIDAKMLDDLRTLPHLKLFVGDHGQLAPVGDDPRLLESADVRLESIQRQADGNSILDFAHHLRTGGDPFEFGKSQNVIIVEKQIKGWPDVDVWLCWRNRTRVGINKALLKLREDDRIPVQIRNNHENYGLFNGEVYMCRVTEWAFGHPDRGIVEHDQYGDIDVAFHPRQWHQPGRFGFRSRDKVFADYGYAVTCHTAQGSEWRNVGVIDESPPEDTARWRYTAATRAAETLIWASPEAIGAGVPQDTSVELF